MSNFLLQYISFNYRYSLSVNLERDLNRSEALEGYVPTERAINALKRILKGMVSGGNRAWTISSVYGTGKSSFALYLTSLLGNSQNPLRLQALKIAQKSLGEKSREYQILNENIPKNGYLRAIATAQREPLSYTLIRALTIGIKNFWTASEQQKISSLAALNDLETEISIGKQINNQTILEIIQDLAKASKTGIFIIIDELGKSLEYTAYNQGAEDLYLLQQLSELPQNSEHPIYMLGILHQTFAEYSQPLGMLQRNEWAKIQGRFEDIPFTESAPEMIWLMGQAITQTRAKPFQDSIDNTATDWLKSLKKVMPKEEFSLENIVNIYPLHPITALVLPVLCQRYAQNDRSLFSFLTSNEPEGLQSFLEETKIDNDTLPTLKVERIYDYFMKSAGIGLGSHPHLQRWVEIQELIADSQFLEPDSLKVLKTIGIFNLITTTGTKRASRELVTLAMCDTPSDNEQIAYWQQIIDDLLKKNIITYRRQGDELRIWQGSDFNIESEVSLKIEQERGSLVELLTASHPLNPLIAQRHSYRTGTIRYFERRYLDNTQNLENLQLENHDSDGLIGYWLEEKTPQKIPAKTVEGKPLILIGVVKLDVLRNRAREYAALDKIKNLAPELQTDGVARKEVSYRLREAKQLLDEILREACDFSFKSNCCWVQGKKEIINNIAEFNSTLSQVCDRVYHQTPILWNELINRRQLTSQGSKARRELITAMLENYAQENLGFSGYGPEVSMYYSLLKQTGIHQKVAGNWGFYPPKKNSDIFTFWQAVEQFCLNAYDQTQSLDKLYQKLSLIPYGIKQGAIPVLITAVIIYHNNDLGVYQDGTFLPILKVENLELLVKQPSRFAVKYFKLTGLRSELLQEFELILGHPNIKKTAKVRNISLLNVVTPLYQFVKKLPIYTKQTQTLNQEALGVLKALQETVEPDELIFTQLPVACNLTPIGTEDINDIKTVKTLKNKLVQALQEIQTAYEKLLTDCQHLLYDAFGISSKQNQIREDLRFRAKYLAGQSLESNLRSFVQVALDEDKSQREWLEAILMVIGDKPAECWTDKDVDGFGIKLSALARRFQNLETLHNQITVKEEIFEARRITLTRPDGEETHGLVWLDHSREAQVNKLVEDIWIKLPENEQLKQAILAKLTEKILTSNSLEFDR